jgi:hypothetical protein
MEWRNVMSDWADDIERLNEQAYESAMKEELRRMESEPLGHKFDEEMYNDTRVVSPSTHTFIIPNHLRMAVHTALIHAAFGYELDARDFGSAIFTAYLHELADDLRKLASEVAP